MMAKKIIIIGSGFGGLASALRMRAKGFDVTLVEKHPDLGGRARVFKRGEFTYDGGPTVITAPYLFDELFLLFNKKISDYVKIVPLDLWYRFVFNDGETFDYNGNDKSMKEQVSKSKLINQRNEARKICKTILEFGVSDEQKIEIMFNLTLSLANSENMKEIAGFLKKFNTNFNTEENSNTIDIDNNKNKILLE